MTTTTQNVTEYVHIIEGCGPLATEQENREYCEAATAWIADQTEDEDIEITVRLPRSGAGEVCGLYPLRGGIPSGPDLQRSEYPDEQDARAIELTARAWEIWSTHGGTFPPAASPTTRHHYHRLATDLQGYPAGTLCRAVDDAGTVEVCGDERQWRDDGVWTRLTHELRGLSVVEIGEPDGRGGRVAAPRGWVHGDRHPDTQAWADGHRTCSDRHLVRG